MNIQLDLFRFLNHLEQVGHSWVQLCKWPFYWSSEAVMDVTKYWFALLPVLFLVWAHSEATEYVTAFGFGVGAWIFCSLIANFYNWKQGNIG